jgi:uncharacterized protein (DUF1778 family)
MAKDAAQEQVHMRVRATELARIDQGAELAGMTRSAFVLAAALEKADAAILDRVNHAWPDAAFAAFRAALDAPPAPAPRAVEAMGRARPWGGA